MRESQAQAEVLRQQHVGQQVFAEVVKLIMTGQGPQQTPQPQSAAGRRVTVSDAEEYQDPDGLDFLGCLNPNSGLPNIGSSGAANKVAQALTNMRSYRASEPGKVREK